MQRKNALNNFKTILGEYCAISQFVELSKRCFLEEHALDIKERNLFVTLATKNKVTLTSYDSSKMVNAISRSYIVNVNLCFETFLKDIVFEIHNYGKNEYRPKKQDESWLGCAVANTVGKLPREQQGLFELCEYYRLVRNTAVHDLCDIRLHDVEYKKLSKYGFKKNTKFCKLEAPNAYDKIVFDDFVMFSRSSVELATYLYMKIEYNYKKIVEDVPEQLKTVWRKYRKNRKRCEDVIRSYINMLYRVDDSLEEQMPQLVELIMAR